MESLTFMECQKEDVLIWPGVLAGMVVALYLEALHGQNNL